jgi:carbon starvation protein CstA
VTIFFASLCYLIYGTIIDRIFGLDPDQVAPAIAQSDGVNFVAMPTWKIMLVQLLNIAYSLGNPMKQFMRVFSVILLLVDKIIGRINPIFDFALVFMAASLITMLMLDDYESTPSAASAT